MTALLTADEAARLRVGVNVIVRAGDERGRMLLGEWMPMIPVAPQAWVALTGPCPTCDGRGTIDTTIRKPHVTIRQAERCPVCRDGRRIVPLYTECPNIECGDWRVGPCPLCGYRRTIDGPSRGRVLVGRGSIEVVPVTNWATCSLDTPLVPHLCWNGSDSVLYPQDIGLAIDAVPGRDFGIVIDVTELA